MSGAKWWENNKSWASVVLPLTETDAAFKEENCLGSIATSIHSVVASSDIGHRLLGRAQR